MNERLNAIALKGVRRGDQLRVRFWPDAATDTVFLIDMHFRQEIHLSDETLRFLENLNVTRQWRQEANRNQVLTVGPEWDAPSFVEQLGHVFEVFEVVPQGA